ncbi:MAG TPA: invasion associated locus B family protein [Hyphomicrobiales bacterium]|nr:invasion associated locus B family protein [Hyphomicrobiales bacterium]
MTVRFPHRLLPLLAAAASTLVPLAAATAAPAATDQPQATTATYHDWILRCAIGGGGRGKTVRACEIVQPVPAPDRRGVAAQIVIGRPEPGKPEHVIVQLPLGVWLPAGATLRLAGAAVALPFQQCIKLCFAAADLDAAALKALGAGIQPARLMFEDAGQHEVSLPVSLHGFSAALDASEAPAAAK